ncbi:MAG TPA: pyridoxal phosphate-dependent aminotransferase [Piscinibacter sp.]|uniref:pyridoxal phosphate-dependent aminotransferase n=1 Tax=Piscinibacter sp. TaxID=1903157 RepID=UPI001B3EB039|nr:pyridoxal phosphate-dependent aminotransferase [Piscinibacter sp.]MBP5989229.1 pyridoxal phosphate-dependent aminotransferase [Piscinibacter sp.]MBP6026813.1 pyridoxal phosphate-dependent aminotransferase [Piscinibacter sp.]HNK17443.1 pyridoxal phosphate-dependent aminotransferase [Piscinibacter sp.]
MIRPVIAELPGSKIREVANAGLGRSDVLAFWFGESDEVTPAFVREAAAASLETGETFYSHNLGLPELREAIARYASGLHAPLGAERIAVTSSGVNALMLAMQALAGAGDEVVAVVPVWPNLTAQPQILGARVTRVPLKVEQGAWKLDLEALLAAVTPATRVLLVNAPNNPTGWTLERAEQQALLEHCRRTGTWIIADEVYERLYYREGARCAPSFLDIATPEDRLVVVHSFSKSFLMTGWRLGWMVAPAALIEAMGKLIEFNTSCAPVFVQRGALAALARADEFVPGLVARMKACRDTLLPALAALPGVSVAVPDGGMYAFFRVQGQDDSLACAKRLVAEVGLGLAPGAAFGAEAEGWLRWCFASRDPARLTDGVGRLARALRL